MAASDRESFEGQCQCGDVRYRVIGKSVALFVCHCTECQRQSSSAFGMALWVEDSHVVVSGATREWIRKTPSGAEMSCRFCPRCGTRLFHQIVGRSILSIKPGTLDDTSMLDPVGHIWLESKQPWIQAAAAPLQYPRNPPDFGELISGWGKARANRTGTP